MRWRSSTEFPRRGRCLALRWESVTGAEPDAPSCWFQPYQLHTQQQIAKKHLHKAVDACSHWLLPERGFSMGCTYDLCTRTIQLQCLLSAGCWCWGKSHNHIYRNQRVSIVILEHFHLWRNSIGRVKSLLENRYCHTYTQTLVNGYSISILM